MKKWIFISILLLVTVVYGKVVVIDDIAPKNDAFNVVVDIKYLGDGDADISADADEDHLLDLLFGGLDADLTSYAGLVKISGGVTSYITDNSATWDTLTLTEEEVEDYVGGMLGGTETLITVTYQDATGDIDFVVDNDLHNYDWTNVDATDLKCGSVTQAYDAQLDDIAALTPTDSYFIVGDGSNWITESGATVRTSLGLGSGDDVEFEKVIVDDIIIDNNSIICPSGFALTTTGGGDIDITADDDLRLTAIDDVVITAADEITFIAGGDTDDYIEITTAGDQSNFRFIGQNGLITAASGTISFDNEILSTSGAIGCGAITTSGQMSMTGGATGAAPTPQISFLTNYYDNAGDASISHTDLGYGQFGFGLQTGTLVYISAQYHKFYDNDDLANPVFTIDGATGNAIIAGTLGAGAITGTSLTIPTTGEINFRDTDISIGSTLFDGILDMSADISIHMFYDNADVGDGVDGQSLNINRRAGEGDDWISLYVDKDRKGFIGFSGDDDLLQLAANALTVNGTVEADGLTLSDLSGVTHSNKVVMMDGVTGTLTTWLAYGDIVTHTEVDDTPVDGVTTDPVSSNWAFDHVAAVQAHSDYLLNSGPDSMAGELTSTGLTVNQPADFDGIRVYGYDDHSAAFGHLYISGSGHTVFTTSTGGNISFQPAGNLTFIASSGEDIFMRLGDNAGANELKILDSDGAKVAYADSDGCGLFLGSYSKVIGGTNIDLYMDNTGLLGPDPSSEQFKENIRPIENSERLHQLQAVCYDRKDGSGDGLVGLIAEDVAQVIPEAVAYKYNPINQMVYDEELEKDIPVIVGWEKTDELLTVNMTRFVPFLIAEVQKLHIELDELKTRVAELEKK